MSTNVESIDAVAGRPHSASRQRLAALALGALGVVYGDIGTSPLYAVKECFHGHHGFPPTPANVLGVLSLIVWALLMVIVLKYLTFIMQADNRGEGGILALLALIGPSAAKTPPILVSLGLFGAALLYGDGVITPAISVLSAIEGLRVAAPPLADFVVPITVMILGALFLVQRKGTAGLGAVFGPATLVWFVSIGVLGVPWIATHPGILAAVSPLHALHFLTSNGIDGFLLLGAVVLCVTGGEALYADMGHFGALPIRIAWYGLVMPALMLNYFGQGALLLDHCAVATSPECLAAMEGPFYALVPGWFALPMVGIATVATVVASQALISGAYSLTRQAVQLGYVPRVKIVHTSTTTEGQIYIPVVNSLLAISCIALVLVAQNSSNLAAAYGIAVTGTMSITSVLFYSVAQRCWGWSRLRAGSLVTIFLVVDLAFFFANVAKILHGGWFPMLAAAGVFVVMSTWKFGATWRSRELQKSRMRFDDLFASLKIAPPVRVKGTAIFMSQDSEGTPPALLHQLKHNQVLHERVVILTIRNVDTPTVSAAERVQVTQLEHGFWRVIAEYGFMESPRVPEVMFAAIEEGLDTSLGRTSYFLGRETFLSTGRSALPAWRRALFLFLARNARSPTEYFAIPPNEVVELGAQMEV